MCPRTRTIVRASALTSKRLVAQTAVANMELPDAAEIHAYEKSRVHVRPDAQRLLRAWLVL